MVPKGYHDCANTDRTTTAGEQADETKTARQERISK